MDNPAGFPENLVTPGVTWFEATGFESVRAPDQALADRIHVVAVPKAQKITKTGAPPELKMPEQYTKERSVAEVAVPTYVPASTITWAGSEVSSGATLLLGTAPMPGRDDLMTTLTALSLRPDGSVVSLDPCGQTSVTDPLRTFVAASGSSAGEQQVVSGLISQGQTGSLYAEVAASQTPKAPKSWIETPADQRQVEAAITPPEYFKRLVQRRVKVTFPKEWAKPLTSADFDSLCVRTSAGWGTCSVLGEWKNGEVELIAFVDPQADPSVTVFVNQGWRFDSPKVDAVTLGAEAGSKAVALTGSLTAPSATVS